MSADQAVVQPWERVFGSNGKWRQGIDGELLDAVETFDVTLQDFLTFCAQRKVSPQDFAALLVNKIGAACLAYNAAVYDAPDLLHALENVFGITVPNAEQLKS